MIEIKQGDITQEDVEVIVNAANSGLKGGGGVDGAIHKAAGPSLMAACRAIGGCPTGGAVITHAGRLKAKRVIHAVGPVWQEGRHGEADLLRHCYTQSFNLAKQEGLKSIAFPAISTGVYRYPKPAAARIALETGLKYEKDFTVIRFICFSQEDRALYEGIWKTLQPV
jgi:O-acetyl-ADP-ribose deacetylase (regulator of RNase III)